MKPILILILFVLTSSISQGQDHHFSQFYNTPLILNPANTGKFMEDYRISMIHRKQWGSIQSDFQTTALGLDMNFTGGVLNKDVIGVGVLVYKDQLPDNIMTTNAFLLSGAYHKYIDSHNRHKISFGLQGGYNQRTINSNNLQFGNQYQNYVYQNDIDNGENIQGNQSNYADLQFGTIYTFKLNRTTQLEGGISLYQILTPEASVTEGGNGKDDIGTRGVFHAGSSHKITPFISLHPRLLYMNQSNSSQINIGAFAGFKIGYQKNFTIYPGLFYRNADAAIALIGLGYQKLDIMFSYDFTTSSLNDVKGANGAENANNIGAWEISLIFKGILKRGTPREYTVPCGIF